MEEQSWDVKMELIGSFRSPNRTDSLAVQGHVILLGATDEICRSIMQQVES